MSSDWIDPDDAAFQLIQEMAAAHRDAVAAPDAAAYDNAALRLDAATQQAREALKAQD